MAGWRRDASSTSPTIIRWWFHQFLTGLVVFIIVVVVLLLVVGHDPVSESTIMAGTTNLLLPPPTTITDTVTTGTLTRPSIASSSSSTSSPVIGILAQPRGDHRNNSNNNNSSSSSTETGELYIAASYIKWLEAGGARTIAIPYDCTDTEYLEDLFQQIHAIFLPGGNTPNLSYAVRYLLNRAWESNDRLGRYFPVWGTCLGFEFLVRYWSTRNDDTDTDSSSDDDDDDDDDVNILDDGFQSTNVSWPLEVVVPFQLYRDPTVYEIVTQHNVTLNNHHYGLSPNQFWSHAGLYTKWQITSMNHDTTGRPFVSTVEPLHPDRFPWYGVQYHPEKNAFEYGTYPHTNIPYEAIDHSPVAIQFSMSMAAFVVNLARRCMDLGYHVYTQADRFPYVYTYPQEVGLAFEQIYIIPATKNETMTTTTTTITAAAALNSPFATRTITTTRLRH